MSGEHHTSLSHPEAMLTFDLGRVEEIKPVMCQPRTLRIHVRRNVTILSTERSCNNLSSGCSLTSIHFFN